MATLETFLKEKARDAITSQDNFSGTSVRYYEHINPDALTDEWLDNGTSYIWKVGVLSVVDGNKSDWVTLYIGQQRSNVCEPEFVGQLHWADGENDDPGRVLKRMLLCAQNTDYVFAD